MVGFINKNDIIFPYYLMKTYGEGTLRKSLIEMLLMSTHIIWNGTWDFGTYRTDKQQSFIRACAYA